jgi:hypothetical protein
MLNYIIATYDANTFEYSLQMQLQTLYTIIMQDKIKYLSQVTIVCPKTKPSDVAHKFYYQKDMWLKLFEKSKVKLVYMDYIGENKSASYDQWLQAYLAYSDFEYFLFIEDDYCIHPSMVDFDSTLVEYYNNKTNGNGGYICTLASILYKIEYHAAISNGLVDKKTMIKLGSTILEDFYKLDEKFNCQLAFSKLFKNKNIDIISMHEDFTPLFWCSKKRKIENFSTNDIKRKIFIPVQYLIYSHFPTLNISIDSTNVNKINKKIKRYRFR